MVALHRDKLKNEYHKQNKIKIKPEITENRWKTVNVKYDNS